MAKTQDQEGQGSSAVAEDQAEKKKLNLQVKIDKPESCLRHVVVTIPRDDIERYRKEAFDTLVPQASVPGFRAGRAPRKLVERHFRERIDDQVKGSLLMDSLSQVTEEQSFSAISEPDFDFESISLPENGDFTYEFKVEVRPEFATPNWKSLPLQRPVETIGDAHVAQAMKRVLSNHSTLQATDEPAKMGDRLVANIVTSKDGKELARFEESRVFLRPTLSFSDARCENFGEVMLGVREGETRSIKVKMSESDGPEEFRGQEIDASFEIVEVLRSESPVISKELLQELGDFESESELLLFVRESLERQAEYRQRESLREQIVNQLTSGASFDLPADLVRRQTRREIERKVLELRRNRFSDEMIQQYTNSMRQTARAATERALREHFILEQIAEDEKIEPSAEEFDAEIEMIAEQSDMPARRVRARLEKSGQMDAVRNQILERKVIDMIAAAAVVTDKAVELEAEEEYQESALSDSAIAYRDTDSIPEAKYEDSLKKEEPLPGAEK